MRTQSSFIRALSRSFLPLARPLLAFTMFAVSTPADASRAYVVESDFSTGSFSSVDAATKATSCDVASVHSDARVRWYAGRVYVVNRFGADNIEVLDGATFGLVKQFSVGNGSNPCDIAFASPTRAYVTRYESTDLWIVDPTTGAHTGTVSLAGLADADGIPEMDRLIMAGPLLFISLQRVNRNAAFQPTDSSLVAVVDTRTDQLVDCDAAHAGVQAILLPRTNPVTPFVFDEPRTRLYLGCVGQYGALDGGIVRVDPAGLVADGVVCDETALGADVLDIAWHDDARAYAIVMDASFNTTLVRWSPVTGERLETLYHLVHASAAGHRVRRRDGPGDRCSHDRPGALVRAAGAQSGARIGAAGSSAAACGRSNVHDPRPGGTSRPIVLSLRRSWAHRGVVGSARRAWPDRSAGALRRRRACRSRAVHAVYPRRALIRSIRCRVTPNRRTANRISAREITWRRSGHDGRLRMGCRRAGPSNSAAGAHRPMRPPVGGIARVGVRP